MAFLNEPEQNAQQQRNMLIAVGVMLAGLLVWQSFMAPKPQPPAPEPVAAESTDGGAAEGDSSDDAAQEDDATPTSIPAADVGTHAAVEAPHRIETESVHFALTNVGARVARAEVISPERYRPRPDLRGTFPSLPECEDGSSTCVEQADDIEDQLLPLTMNIEGLRSYREDAVWEVYDAETRCDGDRLCEQVAYRWVSGDRSTEIIRRFIAEERNFGMRVEVEIFNRGSEDIELDDVEMITYASFDPKVKRGMFNPGIGVLEGFCLENDKQRKKPGRKLDEPRTYTGDIRFGAVVQNYFMSAIAPVDEDGGAGSASRCTIGRMASRDLSYVYATVATGPLEIDPGESHTLRYTYYSGPKPFSYLKEYPHEFTRAVSYGAFSFLALPIRSVLVFFFNLVGNWGLAIILLTISIKLLLLPITTKSFRSMEKMKAVKPKLDLIQKKYENDREKLAQEQMKLFKEEGVNPLSGCLPMLLQMPVYFALYRTIFGTAELYNAPFALWLQDLSQRDPYFILPVAMSAVMFIQQRLMPQTIDNPQMKMMQWLMPLMFIPIMLFLPSGLVLYIFVNMLLSVAQQLYIRKYVRKETAEAGRGGPKSRRARG